MPKTVFEELGKVLRVEVVVELEQEEKGLEEESVRSWCEVASRDEGIGLL